MIGTFLLVAALLAAPPDASAPEAEREVEAQDAEALELELSLRVPAGRHEALGRALSLRLPDARVVDHRTRVDRHLPDVFAEVVATREDGRGVRLTVVLADGRAFVREFDVPPEQWTRVVSIELANLLFAIELDEVEADLTEVGIPRGEAPVVTIRLQPHSAPPDPAPSPGPVAPPAQVPASNSARWSEPVAAPGWHLWGAAGPSALLAVPPPVHGGVFGGAGGGLELVMAHHGGALAGLGLRTLHAPGEPGLTRVRVSAQGGWAIQRPRVRLAAQGVVSAEPFTTRQGGRGRRAELASGVPVTPVLLGLGADVWFAYLERFESRRLELGIGPAVGVSGSFVPGAGVIGVTRISDEGPIDVVRAGGLEIEFGLRVGLGFGLEGRGR